jgi:hypothetical protein
MLNRRSFLPTSQPIVSHVYLSRQLIRFGDVRQAYQRVFCDRAILPME